MHMGDPFDPKYLLESLLQAGSNMDSLIRNLPPTSQKVYNSHPGDEY